jgi:hypothetical protein
MKNQLMFALSLATMAAVSAPLSAQASQGKVHNGGVYTQQNGVSSGCTWYDVNCRLGNGNGTSDGSWQAIGRDQSGNTIYQRQRVDGNGNVIVDRARQDSYGRMVLIDSQVVQQNNNGRRNNVVYGQNNTDCKYKSNKNGYSTNCKYNKANRHGDNDGDANDRNNNGTYNNGTYNNNTSGPWYDQSVNQNNGKGHGKHH